MLMQQLPMLVFAQSRIEAMNEGFRSQQSGNGYAVVFMVIAIAIALGLAAAIYFYMKNRSIATLDDQNKLFAQICRAHGLNRGQRCLVLALAEEKGMKDPNQILLDASLWNLGTTKSKRLAKPKSRNRLVMIQRQLFTPPKAQSSSAA